MYSVVIKEAYMSEQSLSHQEIDYWQQCSSVSELFPILRPRVISVLFIASASGFSLQLRKFFCLSPLSEYIAVSPVNYIPVAYSMNFYVRCF